MSCNVRQRLLAYTLLIAVLLTAGQGLVHAQQKRASAPSQKGSRPLGYVFFNVESQSPTGDFSQTKVIPVNAESGSIASSYAVPASSGFTFGGGAMLTRSVGVGVSVSRFAVETPANVTVSIPHPFFFNRPRDARADLDGLNREELSVQVQARLHVAISPNIQASVFGGPSFVRVTQGLVGDVPYSDTYPYDSITLAQPVRLRLSGSAVGLHVGGDIAYFFSRHVGVGGMLHVARATVPNADGDLRVGGTRIGGGLHVRF